VEEQHDRGLGLRIRIKEQVSKETVVLRRCGVLQDNLVLPTGLKCELATVEIRKLTLRAFDLRRSESTTKDTKVKVKVKSNPSYFNTVKFIRFTYNKNTT